MLTPLCERAMTLPIRSVVGSSMARRTMRSKPPTQSTPGDLNSSTASPSVFPSGSELLLERHLADHLRRDCYDVYRRGGVGIGFVQNQRGPRAPRQAAHQRHYPSGIAAHAVCTREHVHRMVGVGQHRAYLLAARLTIRFCWPSVPGHHVDNRHNHDARSTCGHHHCPTRRTRIIAQINGKRPLRFLMAASCLATVVVLSLTMTSMNNAITQRANTEAESTSLTQLRTSQPGFQLLLWFVSDQTQAQYMPKWNTFIDHAANAKRIRFSSFQTGCTWIDGGQMPNSTCIIMDPDTAEQQHLLTPSDRTPVTVLMPTGGTYVPSSVKTNALFSYAFEQEVAASNHQSLPDITTQDVTVHNHAHKGDAMGVQRNAGRPYHRRPQSSSLDAQSLSGSTTTAMASTGGMTFTYQSRRAIIAALRDADTLHWYRRLFGPATRLPTNWPSINKRRSSSPLSQRSPSPVPSASASCWR